MHLAPEVPVHATPNPSDSPPTFQKFVKSGMAFPQQPLPCPSTHRACAAWVAARRGR